MSKFYLPNGVEIAKDDFLDYYSNSYWIYNDPKIDNYVLNLRSRNKNEWKTDDVFVALAWKMGCIKGWNNELVFFNGWDREQHTVWRDRKKYYSKIDFDDILHKCQKADGNLGSYLSKLKDVKGIGPIYAVTLRYFMEPLSDKNLIYDQFVQRGIDAIIKGIEPRTRIQYREPAFNNVEGLYADYEKCIKLEFEDIFYTREVDQALWVYGHLFK